MSGNSVNGNVKAPDGSRDMKMEALDDRQENVNHAVAMATSNEVKVDFDGSIDRGVIFDNRVKVEAIVKG